MYLIREYLAGVRNTPLVQIALFIDRIRYPQVITPCQVVHQAALVQPVHTSFHLVPSLSTTAFMKNLIPAHHRHPLLYMIEAHVIHVRHLHPQLSRLYQELVKKPQMPKLALVVMVDVAPATLAQQIIDQVQ
jgi:hypothetical protein